MARRCRTDERCRRRPLEFVFDAADAFADFTTIQFEFWFHPGPRPPIPPMSRERALFLPTSLGSVYCIWAISTCSLPALRGPTRENIENQLGPVQNLALGQISQIAHLRR